eukprot:8891531-Pyramimonas_sp.AAC.1
MSASSTKAMLVAHSPFGVRVAWYLESSGLMGKGRATAHRPLSDVAGPSRGLAKDRLYIASAATP